MREGIIAKPYSLPIKYAGSSTINGRKQMLHHLKQGLVIAATLLIIACATTQPVHNVTEAPIATNKPNPSMDQVQAAIVRAGSGLGWQMAADRPGHITGRLLLRTHVAVVDIDYSPSVYSIKYRESTNLDYDGGNIHKNYNGWIQNLDKAIKVQLQNL